MVNARADLYEGARWYLTPTESSSGLLYDRIQKLVAGLGARPMAIEAAEHDRAMAVVSHLPHVFANQLAFQGRPGTERLGALAPSLRDATRVAGSNPAIWGEIFSTNHAAVVEAIDRAIEGLAEAREVIASADVRRITGWQAAAAAERAGLSGAETEAEAEHELRVLVPNRPGVLAELALALGKAGVNITDMSLDPTPDMSSGAISIWVSGAERGRQGRALHLRVSATRSACPTRSEVETGRFSPVGPAGRQAHSAGRQVDLPPGGDHRRDRRRSDPGHQLPRLRRHPLDPRARSPTSARWSTPSRATACRMSSRSKGSGPAVRAVSGGSTSAMPAR